MESGIFDFLMHMDRHLADLVEAHPVSVYALIFLVLFAETGLIFLAILPGDSLLFAAGALAASQGMLDLRILLPLMVAAVFLGDQFNYLLGRWVGERPFKRNGHVFNRRSLDKAKRFYKKHGMQTVILGRFIPVIRSVTPLAAAVTGMPYKRFMPLSLGGTVFWTALFLFLGFALGDLEIVKGRFALVLGAVLLVTLLPGLIQLLAERRHGHRGHGALSH